MPKLTGGWTLPRFELKSMVDWVPVLILMGLPLAILGRLSSIKTESFGIATAGAVTTLLLVARLRRNALRSDLAIALCLSSLFAFTLAIGSSSGLVWRHLGAVAVPVTIGFLLAQEPLETRLREVAWLSTFVAGVSLISAVLMPRHLTFVAFGSKSWTGIAFLPDAKLVGLGFGLAPLFAVGIVVLSSPPSNPLQRRSLTRLLMVIVSSVALVLTNNLTLVIGVGVALVSIWTIHQFRQRELLAMTTTACLFLVVSILAFLALLLEIPNRGQNLTGRLPIWENLLGQAALGLTGSGPGQFWRANAENSALYLGANWRSYSSHSSWLTIALDYGLIGLFVVCLGLVVTLLWLLLSPSPSAVVGGGIVAILLVVASTGDVIMEATAGFALVVWLALSALALRTHGAMNGSQEELIVAESNQGESHGA
jgi:hypothetical protein